MMVLPGEADNMEGLRFHPIRGNRERERKRKRKSVIIGTYLYSLTTDQKIKSNMMTQ